MHHFEADSMQADFAEVGTADFSEICLRLSVAGEAPFRQVRQVPGQRSAWSGKRRSQALTKRRTRTHGISMLSRHTDSVGVVEFHEP